MVELADISVYIRDFCGSGFEACESKGSNGVPMGGNGGNEFGEFLFFLFDFVFYGLCVVYIIPKWLIKVPGPIPIFFDDFGNFENFVKIWARGPPNYYQTT